MCRRKRNRIENDSSEEVRTRCVLSGREVKMATVAITKQNFEAEVLQSEQPVLLDFWAPWCGPCRMVGPVIEELSEEVLNVKFAKLNVDEEPEVAEKYGIMSIPTLILFRNGEIAKRVTGARGKAELNEWLEA